MSFRINSNIPAANAYRNLQATSATQSKALERLSSGFRINRAGDDAAGLVLSENLRSLTSGIGVAVRNAQDGIGVVQTAEGALTEVHSILQRMRDLAVGAANGGSMDSVARTASQDEVDALTDELDRISNTTKFGNLALLDGTYGTTASKSTGFVNTSTVTLAANADFDFNVSTSAGADVTVSLTAGTYSGAEMAAHLESAIRSALSAGDADQKAAASQVTVKATTVGSGFALEISGALAATENINLAADGTNTPLADLGFSVAAGTAAVGSAGVFQVGAENSASDRISVSIADLRVSGGTSANMTALAALDLSSTTNAQSAIDTIDDAIELVSATRGDLGAVQNRFEHTISNLRVTQENLMASESRIRDADMALEMVSFTRSQVLTQAGTAMLAQANQAPQAVLSLLRG